MLFSSWDQKFLQNSNTPQQNTTYVPDHVRRRRKRILNYTSSLQTSFVLQGVLEMTDCSQNSRLGSALAQIPDMNGDGFRELVVGAPLEDDHQGAVYIFYGQDKTIQHQYRQVTDDKPCAAKLNGF